MKEWILLWSYWRGHHIYRCNWKQTHGWKQERKERVWWVRRRRNGELCL